MPAVRRSAKPVQEVDKKLFTQLCRLASPLPPLAVPTSDGYDLIRPFDVVYATAKGRGLGVTVVTCDGESSLLPEATIESLEGKVAADPRFFRTHERYLVNLFRIFAIERPRGARGATLLCKEVVTP